LPSAEKYVVANVMLRSL